MLLEDLTAKCGHFNCGLSAVPISENAKGEKWFFLFQADPGINRSSYPLRTKRCSHGVKRTGA